MSVPIFMSYMDYCKERNKKPSLEELIEWKRKYNDR